MDTKFHHCRFLGDLKKKNISNLGFVRGSKHIYLIYWFVEKSEVYSYANENKNVFRVLRPVLSR